MSARRIPRRIHGRRLSWLLLSAATLVRADDTDVFFAPAAAAARPNLLVLVDASEGTGPEESRRATARLAQVQAALRRLLATLPAGSVNLGLARLSGTEGAAILFPVAPLDARLSDVDAAAPADGTTVREALRAAVDGLEPAGAAPIAEGLYEVAQYFRGGDALFGRTRGDGASLDDTDADEPDARLRLSHRAAFRAAPQVLRPPGCTETRPGAQACRREHLDGAGQYRSPLTGESCQASAIILLAGTAPGGDDHLAAARDLAGAACDGREATATCAPALARVLASGNASVLPGGQRLRTFVVAVGDGDVAETWLRDVAREGQGSFTAARDAGALAAALDAIIDGLQNRPAIAVAAVPLTSFNRMASRDEAYVAMFRPQMNAAWPGNLKRYRYGGDPPALLDRSSPPRPALDPGTGLFRVDASSFWSRIVDGADVTQGGLLARLPDDPGERRVFTFTGTYDAGGVPSRPALSDPANALSEDNAAVSKALLDIPGRDDAGWRRLRAWARGVDVRDENGDGRRSDARRAIGDPLHSRPVAVAYGGGDDPDVTLFFGDNLGFLHAVNAGNAADTDPAGGTEWFAFIPQELLKNLAVLYDDSVGHGGRPYGFDGPLTAWHDDVDGNARVDPGEAVWIYGGLRRGGRNYYALDVGDRRRPRLAWVIRGGPAAAGGDGRYTELSQTWSRMVPARLRFDGRVRDVLVFSGGYDPAQDRKATRSADAAGRALYIADARTGSRLWWAGGPGSGADVELPELRYSVAASPKVLDLDGDGLADRIYFADMGAQVFRIVLDNAHNTGAATLTGTAGNRALRIADLGAAGADGARRFMASPDVAWLQGPEPGDAPFLAISFGSGFREDPLGMAVQDRFYVLRDPDAGAGAPGALAITENDLLDVSSRLDAARVRVDLAGKRGIRLSLQPGEKVFTEAKTFAGKVLFASYRPQTGAPTSCATPAGASRLYALNVLDGRPAQGTTAQDRYRELRQPGLPADPVLLFPARTGALPQEAVVCVGAECSACPGGMCRITTQETWWWKSPE